ncbi:MAG: helicase HerA-like domain-containing protein [Geodermatophilaceae bacterium]
MAPSDGAVRQQVVAASGLHARYADAVDRDSAYERLAARVNAPPPPPAPAPRKDSAPTRGTRRGTAQEDPSVVTQILDSGAFKSFMRSAGSALGRTLFGTRRRR